MITNTCARLTAWTPHLPICASSKSVHDAGWSAFVSMLEYKAARYGRTFIRIGRCEPTSQVCSQCGVKDGPKPLNVREWTCQACGAVLDRDINAAVNVPTESFRPRP